MKQVWACGQCRSINDPRATRCYKCLTPRGAGEVDSQTLSTTHRDVVKAAALPPFHSPTPFAIVAAALVGGVVILQLVNSMTIANVIEQGLDGLYLSDADLASVGAMQTAALLLAIAALVAFAFWLSKVVAAMPSIGLGYTPVTPRAAIIETLIPIFNLFRVPPILRDVMARLEPDNGRPPMLIAAAWLGIVLGILVPRVGGVLVGFADGVGGAHVSEIFRQQIALDGIATGLLIVGGIGVLAIIGWIEMRIRRHVRTHPVEPAEPITQPPPT